MRRAFPDTNVIVYAFTDDPRRHRARAVLEQGGLISAQTLNEFANVAQRKLGLDWDETRVALRSVRTYFPEVAPVDVKTHEAGLRLASGLGFSIYDAMIVAAALHGGCDILWSEDMHDGLVVDGRLRIVNPFA